MRHRTLESTPLPSDDRDALDPLEKPPLAGRLAFAPAQRRFRWYKLRVSE